MLTGMISRRRVPASLIDEQHGVRARCYWVRDFRQVKLIVALLHQGSDEPAATLRSGQIAPKM